MTDTFIDTPAEPARDRTQLAAAVLLGLAATLTAFSAYNAALKDGEALQGYTASSRTLSDANAFYAQGNQTFALDQQLFVSYAAAAQEGDADLAAFLTTLMRPELTEAITWWEDEANQAVTPFDEADDNPYALQDFTDAEELEAQADEEFAEASVADDVGDAYELATVFFALTLFFGGVAHLFARRTVTLVLLGIGVATLLVGLVSLLGA